MPKYSLQRKRDRVVELIERLKSGQAVQARDVELVLTAAQCKEMRKDWKQQQELRKEKKPSAITDYERILQEALMWYGRYENMSGKKPMYGKAGVKQRQSVIALELKQLRLFEDAYERLQEILVADRSLEIWFDREIDFSFLTKIGIDPEHMPRVKTSRSLENLADKNWKQWFGIKTKTEHKIDVLTKAFAELDTQLMTDEEKNTCAKQQAENSAKLKLMLAKLKNQSRN